MHVHLLNLGTQNAPGCVSEHLNFQNFPGGNAPGPPLVVRTFGAQIGRYAPKLSPPASLSSTSTSFEKENPERHGQKRNLIKGKWLQQFKVFFDFLSFIAIKAYILSIKFIAEIKTKQEKLIWAMKIDQIDDNRWRSILTIFLVIDFHRFPILIN